MELRKRPWHLQENSAEMFCVKDQPNLEQPGKDTGKMVTCKKSKVRERK